MAAKAAPQPSRRITDLAPRRPSPSSSSSPTPHAAGVIHSRTKPASVLDLRDNAGGHDLPAAPPHTAVRERHLAHYNDRLGRAKQVSRSPHVSRFGGLTPAAAKPAAPAAAPASPLVASAAAPSPASAAPAMAPPPVRPVAPRQPSLPGHVAAQHRAMAGLTAKAPAPAAAPPPHTPTSTPAFRPHLSLSPQSTRVAAISAAVMIMAGYVWLQNYPKLSLQAASSRAGISASLPGFVPSSYNLARTDTAPGLVTLRFTSPSVPDTLKIAQARTTWDSSSLLDNYVVKHTDDYSSVQGQGLTIYLYGQNQATWVNHGVWYSIEGASRLSREQILKIAFSL